MKKMLQINYFIYCLFTSHFSLSRKCIIFFSYIGLFLKRIFRSKHNYIKIFGFKIKGRSLSHIIGLFGEIFLKNEYRFRAGSENPIIIDGGSNIGMNIFYRKTLYPEAVIYCFEPDVINFEILRDNIVKNKLDNIFVYNQAIGETNGTIDFFYQESNLTTSSIFNKRGGNKKINIEVIKLSDFIKDNKIEGIDLLKLDIEGSENQCIRDLDKNDQLQKVKNLIIEYHNNIDGKEDRLGNFLNILEKAKFICYIEADKVMEIKGKINQDFMIYAINND